MRDYGKVHTTFWTSSSIRELSEDGRMLAMYLLTCPHGTIAGVFRIPDGYACEDLQWNTERVRQGFTELFRKGFANRCETTKWVWVVKHFAWNSLENPNQKKSAVKVAAQVPDQCCWKSAFMRASGGFMGMSDEDIENACRTLSEGFRNQEQEQEQKQEPSSSLRSEEGSAATATTPAPAKPKREPRSKTTLAKFLAACKSHGTKPVPDDHAIRTWAAGAGITEEMLQVAWLAFRERYIDDPNNNHRQYKDWAAAFANSVKGNWFGLWFSTETEGAQWASKGLARKQALDATRAARQQQEAAHAPA